MIKIAASLRHCVNPFCCRPSEGWGPLRLSFEHSASWFGGIGPSLRWGDCLCDGGMAL